MSSAAKASRTNYFSRHRQDMQSAYRILVGSVDAVTPAAADFWGSGVVRSARAMGIVYGDRRLDASRRHSWRVPVCVRTPALGRHHR